MIILFKILQHRHDTIAKAKGRTTNRKRPSKGRELNTCKESSWVSFFSLYLTDCSLPGGVGVGDPSAFLKGCDHSREIQETKGHGVVPMAFLHFIMQAPYGRKRILRRKKEK